MYNRLSNFLGKKMKFLFQFDFRQTYFIIHALIHPADKISHEVDEGNCACGIFVDFQNALDTVDHHILLKETRTIWCQRNF